MTIKDFLEQFETWVDNDRGQIAPLFKLLCPCSVEQLRQFQGSWDCSRPYDEFVAEQNTQIRECVEMELSPLGVAVREMNGLSPLTEETEIPGT